ncbi:MAG TPA: 50S ribosomal protein L7ae-like protein [Clostridiaceae bacterium]|nr:50S ribosomal protein L7ae-like protein [Clostridiaceae bacterium]
MMIGLQGKKVVGVKQTLKVIKGGKASIVYIAKDAEDRVTIPVSELCRQNSIELIYVNTMKELGHMCGIDVGAATAALINE